jgi:hypothetical protein
VKTKEELVEILTQSLADIYCYNCYYKGSEDNCDECSRKSMNWAISDEYAEKIADKILD